MNKIICMLVLTVSTMGTVCAQNKTDKTALTKTDQTFELPANTMLYRFAIDLGKGNSMQLECREMDDLDYIKNIDSLVADFLHNLAPLKDSLSNELTAKRIDYVADSMGRKKIRIQQHPSKGSSYLVTGDEVAALKLEQDTVYIIGTIPDKNPVNGSKKAAVLHYYRVGFFINQLAELPAYLDGKLSEKISMVQKNKVSDWARGKDDQMHLDKDYSISAKQARGYSSGPGDYLELNAGVALQNYKNYFVPSFKLSASVFMNVGHYKHQFGLAWEPHFMFATNSQGNLVTYRNDFITLILGREPIKSRESDNDFHFSLFQHMSIGYLVSEKGDFFDKHTFRLGTGAASWKGEKIKLEPVFYFHDFFKNVTPGLRLSINF